MSRTITIPNADLPTNVIGLTEKGRGQSKHLAWEPVGSWSTPEQGFRPDIQRDQNGGIETVTLSEFEIHEYAAQALKELEVAENALARAKDRADAIRMFARELYAAPVTLKVASE